ncbi:MAG: hypothetical protein Q9214_006376 [Letrouitia sp. 1 TL-2023]
MPFGRPPVSTHNISHQFERLDRPSVGGGGCFNAGVFVVRQKSSGRICVEKKLKPEDVLSDAAEFEICLLRQLKHPNIVEYVDAFIDMHSCSLPQASIYMAYCDLPNLEDTVWKHRQEKRPLKEETLRSLLGQLTNAISYIQYGIQDAVSHQEHPNPKWNSIVHRDIKPSNIFLRSSNTPNVRIPTFILGDFGQAVCDDDDVNHWHRAYRIGGHKNWQPSEILDYGPSACSFSSDVWSVGAVVSFTARLGIMKEGVGHAYSSELNDTVLKMMDPNYRLRPRLWEYAAQVKRLVGLQWTPERHFKARFHTAMASAT